MTNENHRPTPPDNLDEVIAAWRAAPVSPGPPAELIATTLVSLENRLAGVTHVSGTRLRPRRRILKKVGYVALAVAALVPIGVFLAEFVPGTAAAFDKSLERVAKTE